MASPSTPPKRTVSAMTSTTQRAPPLTLAPRRVRAGARQQRWILLQRTREPHALRAILRSDVRHVSPLAPVRRHFVVRSRVRVLIPLLSQRLCNRRINELGRRAVPQRSDQTREAVLPLAEAPDLGPTPGSRRRRGRNCEGRALGSLHRGRDLKLRSRSLHRKARSLSPLRSAEFQWLHQEENDKAKHVDKEDKQSETTTVSTETTPSCSASSSRSSSAGRNSKKWVFLKDLLNRSKSEGRGNGKEKFWSYISSKEKPERQKQKQKQKQKQAAGRPTNGVAAAKRRGPARSPHELHYTTNRAQAEELKKRTYLPYKQGLLGCLGFSSKGYGALNGLTRALNPVSSR
ncbi:hypothetical protein SLA2020_423520 [Shorea laevis]